mmetsp:Transcript_33773/g.69120  ORF Transcript_33773/g.69120 Transcript_33773/m.69120 type:complete len:93 (+) Transcript_33773:298-576(+)
MCHTLKGGKKYFAVLKVPRPPFGPTALPSSKPPCGSNSTRPNYESNPPHSQQLQTQGVRPIGKCHLGTTTLVAVDGNLLASTVGNSNFWKTS